MLGSYRVYDADAYVILAPAMWEDLAESSFTLPTIPTARREKMLRRICWSERTPPKMQKHKILYNSPVRFFGEP
jgi:hypothetical protein